jgi:hypothetical protein
MSVSQPRSIESVKINVLLPLLAPWQSTCQGRAHLSIAYNGQTYAISRHLEHSSDLYPRLCACPAQSSPALEMNRDALPLPPKPLHFRPK